MMEAESTSETSVNFNVTTRRNIQKDSKFHTRRRENLKHYEIKTHVLPFAERVTSRQTGRDNQLAAL
jgi:hypothetical protein